MSLSIDTGFGLDGLANQVEYFFRPEALSPTDGETCGHNEDTVHVWGGSWAGTSLTAGGPWAPAGRPVEMSHVLLSQTFF